MTVQLVRAPGFWEGEVGPLRTLQRGHAAKQGGRVTTNVLARDLDLAAPHVDDARRLEVVVDRLPLFAVDTRLVSTLRADGSCRGGLLNMTGWAAEAARLRKVRTYPELVGAQP